MKTCLVSNRHCAAWSCRVTENETLQVVLQRCVGTWQKLVASIAGPHAEALVYYCNGNRLTASTHVADRRFSAASFI